MPIHHDQMFSITRISCFVISGLIALLCPRAYVSYMGKHAANINFPYQYRVWIMCCSVLRVLEILIH